MEVRDEVGIAAEARPPEKVNRDSLEICIFFALIPTPIRIIRDRVMLYSHPFLFPLPLPLLSLQHDLDVQARIEVKAAEIIFMAIFFPT